MLAARLASSSSVEAARESGGVDARSSVVRKKMQPGAVGARRLLAGCEAVGGSYLR